MLDEGGVGESGFLLDPLEFLVLDLMVKPYQSDDGPTDKQDDDAPQEQQAGLQCYLPDQFKPLFTIRTESGVFRDQDA